MITTDIISNHYYIDITKSTSYGAPGYTSPGYYGSPSPNYNYPLSSPSVSSPYNKPNSISGDVRYHNSELEVYDGSGNWLKITNGPTTISLNPMVISTLEWAHKKMMEEQELKILAQNNTAIASLVEQIEDCKSKIKLVQILVKK